MGLDILTVEKNIFQIPKAKIQTWFNSTLNLVPLLLYFILLLFYFYISKISADVHVYVCVHARAHTYTHTHWHCNNYTQKNKNTGWWAVSSINTPDKFWYWVIVLSHETLFWSPRSVMIPICAWTHSVGVETSLMTMAWVLCKLLSSQRHFPSHSTAWRPLTIHHLTPWLLNDSTLNLGFQSLWECSIYW